MKIKLSTAVFLLLQICCCATAAFAQTSIVLLGTSKLHSDVSSLSLNENKSIKIEPILLQAGLGKNEVIKLFFNRERSFKGLAGSNVKRILQGHAIYKTRRGTVTAPLNLVVRKLDEGLDEIRILAGTDGARVLGKRTRMISLRGKLSGSENSRLRLQASKPRKKDFCGVKEHKHTAQSSLSPSVPVKVKAGLKQLDVLVAADVEFFKMAGSAAMAEITESVSMTDVIYRRDLGLTVNANIIREPQTYAARWIYDDNTEFEFFIEMHQRHGDKSEDLFAIFTGKPALNKAADDIIGLAYLDAVCGDPYYTYATIRRYEDEPKNELVLTFAHEIGHNLGGNHDDAHTDPNVGYIMNAESKESMTNRFSDYSKNEISQFVSTHNSCLADSSAEPPSDDTEFGIEAYLGKSGKKTVPVFLAYEGEYGVPNYKFSVYKVDGKKAKVVAKLKTDVYGEAIYKKATKGKYYAVPVSDPSIKTNTVNVKK